MVSTCAQKRSGTFDNMVFGSGHLMETFGERLMHQLFSEQEHDSLLFCLPSFACVCLFHMCFVLTSLTWTSKGPREGATVREGRSRTQTLRDFLCIFLQLICLHVHLCAVNHMMTFLTFGFVHKRCAQARRDHLKLRGVTCSLLVVPLRGNTSKMSTWLDSGHVFWETTADLFFLISRSQWWRTLRLLLVWAKMTVTVCASI